MNPTKALYTTMTIRRIPIEFKLDTGADANVLSFKQIRNLPGVVALKPRDHASGIRRHKDQTGWLCIPEVPQRTKLIKAAVFCYGTVNTTNTRQSCLWKTESGQAYRRGGCNCACYKRWAGKAISREIPRARIIPWWASRLPWSRGSSSGSRM